MEQDPKSKKDLILWLLAAALAIILYLAEKTPFWTGFFLVVLFAVLVHPVSQMPWIRGTRKRQVVAWGFLVCLVVCFGFVVWPTSGNSLTIAISDALALGAIVRALLKKPQIQYGLCVGGGMLLLAFIQYLKRQIAVIRRRKINRRTGTKGFLDYKMQAEDGMRELSPQIEEISGIIVRVGCSLNDHIKIIQSAQTDSARIQLKKVRQTARMLDGYSRRLDNKCDALEEIGDSLAEGIEEWMKWMSTLPGASAFREQLGPLRSMAKSTEIALNYTNSYLESVGAYRGVSLDMNDAVNSHLISITRVRDTIEKILKSCLGVLRRFDAIAPV